MLQWIIQQKYSGMSIREYLRTVHHFSNRLLTAIIHHGGFIDVNGKRRTVKHRLMTGDRLTVKFPPEKRGPFMTPEPIPLSIVYEDNDLIIINKPPHIATMPSFNHPSGTIANGLLWHYEANQLPYTVHVVTRLDRNTSGLMLIAKHRYCHALLAQAQQNGQIERAYKALVHGQLSQKCGTINERIGRKDGSMIERTVTNVGKKAITYYEVIKGTKKYSLVHIQLETGRTHQIRVHFSYIGHPLIGDELYGGDTTLLKRQALHCHKLSFIHPITGEKKSFQVTAPADMQRLLTL